MGRCAKDTCAEMFWGSRPLSNEIIVFSGVCLNEHNPKAHTTIQTHPLYTKGTMSACTLYKDIHVL